VVTGMGRGYYRVLGLAWVHGLPNFDS